MTEFGLALVIGGLAFATSMVPVVAYTLNFGFFKARPKAPVDNAEYRHTTRRFKLCFTRDMIFIMTSLTLYYIALEIGTITVPAICFQLIVFIFYILVVWYMDK